MLNRDDVDSTLGLADAVHDPVVASMGAVKTVQFESERTADQCRTASERSVDELDRRGCNLFR